LEGTEVSFSLTLIRIVLGIASFTGSD
jgi:hypothetical protein